jgi:hypothetical protein
MATNIPEELKKDVPQTTWGKLLVATPVVMTVVATLLAGLASSEMTRAQYDRAYAAQLQAKAGDQWSYFQAKKLRGAIQRNSLELLRATTDVHPLSARTLPNVTPPVLAVLEKNQLPAVDRPPMADPVKVALAALEKSRPEAEIGALLKPLKADLLAAALESAKDNAIAFDTAIKPIGETLDQLETSLPADRAMARDFAAARMRFNAARYEAEAQLNQTIANLLELQVRQSNLSAERHHTRSGHFFLGMLGAQAAVIVSTLAMAARQRNLLWTLAAVAGIAAVVFAIYVYVRL